MAIINFALKIDYYLGNNIGMRSSIGELKVLFYKMMKKYKVLIRILKQVICRAEESAASQSP